MEVKIIKSRSDYQTALKHLAELLEKNPLPGSKDENKLELLVVVIRDYEKTVIEPIDVDPIEAIKFRMDQMELSRKELVPYLGSISRVSEILSGKRDLSLSMIRKLHEGLGIPLESLVKRPTRKVVRKRRVKSARKRPFSIKRRRKSYSS